MNAPLPFPTPAEAIADRYRPDRRVPDAATAGLPAGAPEPAAGGLRLQITSGPQSGAGLLLTDGHTLLGTGLDCDLVLHLDTDPPLRALLSLVDGCLSATALAGPLQVGATVVERGDTVSFSAGTRLQLGEVTLWIGQPGPAPAPEPAPELEQAPDAAHPEPAAPPAEPSTAEATANTAAPSVSPPARQRLWPLWATAGCGLLLTGAAAVFGLGDPPEAVAPPAATAIPTRAALTAVCRELALHDVVVAGSGAVPALAGYVTNEAVLRKLRQTLAQKGYRIAVQVHTGEQLLAGARAMLNDSRLAAVPRYHAAGHLLLEVAENDFPAARGVAVALVRDLPGVNEVSVVPGGMPAAVVPDGQPLPAARVQVRRNERGEIQVVDQTVLPLAAVFSGRNQVAYIDTGARPSIQTVSGRRIFEGGLLDARTQVLRITPDQLIIAADGRQRRVALQ